MSTYKCEVCDYSTDNKNSYNIHLKTKKHQMNVDNNKHQVKNQKQQPKSNPKPKHSKKISVTDHVKSDDCFNCKLKDDTIARQAENIQMYQRLLKQFVTGAGDKINRLYDSMTGNMNISSYNNPITFDNDTYYQKLIDLGVINNEEEYEEQKSDDESEDNESFDYDKFMKEYEEFKKNHPMPEMDSTDDDSDSDSD